MKRWLLCLFTYNRFGLLCNAVESVNRFFPWGDRLIIDDGSTDPRVAPYLRSLAQSPQWRYKIMDRPPGREYGGFYVNMRYGLETALSEGYDYCVFLEDDHQYVWHKPDLPEYIEHVFKTCPDAIQLLHLFLRRILSYGATHEYIRSAHAYRGDRGFNTSGIWNLDAVRRHPDYRFFCSSGDDLPTNSAYWLKNGYRLYSAFDPGVAIIPWVHTQKFGQKFGSDHSPTARPGASETDLLLKPLTPEEIEFLRNRPPELPPYQEYFDLSAENTARPIWHQRGFWMHRYYFLCRSIVDEENAAGKSPLPIPSIETWAPTTIPPVGSHVNRDRLPPTPPLPLWRRRLPKRPRRLRRLASRMVHFNVRDYLGYLTLCRCLRRERMALPFNRAAQSPSGPVSS